MSREKKDAIEGLKNSLYSRNGKSQEGNEERTPLSPSQDRAPVSWSDIKKSEPAPEKAAAPLTPMAQKKRLSYAAKFFIGSVGFFAVAIAVAAYMFFFGGNTISPQNIDIQVVAPSLIDSGKQAALQILIDNRNPSALQLVDLIIDYPQGTRDASDETKSLTHERQTIGTIASGQQVKRTANAVFYGQEGTQQKVAVTLEYSVPGSNAIFEKQAEGDFTIGSSPVSISVNAPSEAIAGQQFPIDITVQSNATAPVDNVVIQGQYPFGFTVAGATPSAEAGGTLWRLGTLAPGSSQTIHLIGSIDGQDGDQRVFRFLAGSDADQTDTQIKVPFLSVPQTITVRRPFITAALAINGQSGKTIAVPPGTQLSGTVTWKNNLPETISDVQIVLSLSGPMLDKSSVTSNGFYQSSGSTITWTKDQDSSLASVPPGGTGTLSFNFTTQNPGAGGVLYANPVINLNVGVQGVRQGQDNVPQTVSSAAATQVTIASALALSAHATHFSGPYQNIGPMPPVAEQNTSYTVSWTVSNSSNTIANATVSATLPPYVQFLKGQGGVVYDAGSRTVSWTIGDLKAGVGYTLPADSASFQVLLTPSDSQVGQSPPLTSPATLTGLDRFAQVPVQAIANSPTTVLTGDSGFDQSMSQIAPK